jgi:hypothetical protein
MNNTQHIPHDGARVETGAVQFGDDWPGVFIRGDEALSYIIDLKVALKKLPPDKEVEYIRLTKLLRALQSCRQNNIGQKP